MCELWTPDTELLTVRSVIEQNHRNFAFMRPEARTGYGLFRPRLTRGNDGRQTVLMGDRMVRKN